MSENISFSLAEKAVNKINNAEKNIGIFEKSLLLLKQQNIFLSDDLINTFDRLTRLSVVFKNDNEISKSYNELSRKINNQDWGKNYIKNAQILNKYLKKLNGYLSHKYPLKMEMEKDLIGFKKNIKKSLSRLLSFQTKKGIDFKKITEEIKKQTNYTYFEISNLLSTSRSIDIIAYTLNISKDLVFEYYNTGKKIEIITELIKLKKLGFVISAVLEHKDKGLKIAGLK